jgi:uncharacterized protein YmfQ (DUF2313 family)
MAVIDIYGEQSATVGGDIAFLDVTDVSATPEVMRQFPLGGYWDRTVGWLPGVARAIARFFSRLRRGRETLTRQFDPRTADILLPEREAERAVVPIDGQTIEERRATVLAKMRAEGGVNAAYYTQVCVNAGYLDAVVTSAADPFTTVSTADDFLAGGLWMVTMRVTATTLGPAQDQALQNLIKSQLQAGFYVVFTFLP